MFIPKKNYELYKEAIKFEQSILNESCGSQDQIITAAGGFKKISYSSNNIIVKNLKITNQRKKEFENSNRPNNYLNFSLNKEEIN